MWFKKLFKSKSKKKDWYRQYPELRIVPAFTLAKTDEYPETTYYEFEDPNNITAGRAFAAQNFYKELSMACTREFLIAHTTAIDKLLRGKSIDIYEIAKLNAQLKERLDLIIDSITPYKLASVVFFDETEDPFNYDYAYNWKKIERFKQAKESFFLSVPVRKLIPSLDWSEETLQNYLMISGKIDQEHHRNLSDVLSQVLSEKEKSSDWLKVLNLEKNII